MSVILSFLASVFGRYFASLATRIGLQKTLYVAMFAAWTTFTAAFYTVAQTCVSPQGVCGALASTTSGLSEWILFGFSLVPSEIISIMTCLVSLHIAGYAYLVMIRIVMYYTTLGRGTGLRL